MISVLTGQALADQALPTCADGEQFVSSLTKYCDKEKDGVHYINIYID